MTISIEQQIVEAGEQNSELHETLSSTEGAASALAEQKRLLGDLRVNLKWSKYSLEDLEAERQKRLGEYEKYDKSHVRRLMFEVSGMGDKFAQRVEDGKREYLKADQDVQKERGIIDGVVAKMDEAHRRVSPGGGRGQARPRAAGARHPVLPHL